MNAPSVDVIIPVYRPDERFRLLLDRLARQSLRPSAIILMATDEASWYSGGGARMLQESKAAELAEVHFVTKKAFDHARTRSIGVEYSRADYFVCMTQDAVPCSPRLLERLILPMDESVRLTYARQRAAGDADPIERITRAFNYPARSRVKTSRDLPELGIKTFFASNVCAAYKRKTFDRLGGFPDRAIFNEDMIYAAKVIKAGYAVKYCAGAEVIHSHNYTALQNFRRNFDNGVSQAMHPEVFDGIRSESEGIRLVRSAGGLLARHGYASLIPKLLWQCGWKYLGFFLGRRYRLLPPALRRQLSMNKEFWNE